MRLVSVTRKAMRALQVIIVVVLCLGVSALAQTGGAAAQVANPHPNAVPESISGSEKSSKYAMVPASNPRVQKLGHKLMCMCGCNSILPECDHQGTNRCLMHDKEMAELRHRVASGESNSLILQSFVQEYGPQVLVVPPAKGFDLTAWLMPIFASLFGLSLAIIVVQRWRDRAMHQAPVPAANRKPRPDLIAKARADTEDEDYY